MSRSAFAGRFAAAFGQSPLEFVQRVRMRQAARMLSATMMPVGTIGQSIGYASCSHFSRTSQAAYGMDPTTFRTRHPGPEPIPLPKALAPQ